MLEIASAGGPEIALDSPRPFFPRLRDLALSDAVTEAQREEIRRSLPETLERVIESLRLALEACDGVDPEVGLLLTVDAAFRAAQDLSVLDSKIL